MDWTAFLLGVLMNILRLITLPYFWYKAKDGPKYMPKITDPVLTISATKLAKKIREKELTSVEIIKAYIDRIRTVNPYLNAVVEERFEEALKEAKSVDDFIEETTMSVEELAVKKPLLGVPLTVKESCSLEGMKLTIGALARIDERAKADGEPIHRLKKAGAIPLLVSNVPEYTMCWETDNLVTGRTNNPYDTTRTSGGSSGGEGALLAAAASVIGVGSDLGGSIRIPSAFNGIFGHKPTRQIVSTENHYPIHKSKKANEMNNVGPMCRYAEDLTLMLKIMTGDKANELGLDEEIDLKNIEVYYMEEGISSIAAIEVQSEIKRAVRKAAAHLRDNCKSKVRVDTFPSLCDAFFVATAGMVIFDYHNLDTDAGIVDRKNFSLGKEIIKSLLGRSIYSFQLLYFHLMITISQFLHGNKMKQFEKIGEDLRAEMIMKLKNNSVFLYPTFPRTAHYHGQFTVNGLSIMYTMVFNILGFPSTSVPIGFDEEGLPVAIQVIAAPKQDKLCLAVAKELEKKFGGWVSPS